MKEILEDLYRLDPELRKDEGRLVPIIEKLLAARPDTGFDEKFRIELRAKVLAALGSRVAAAPSPWKAVMGALFSAPRPAFAVSGVVLGALLMAVVLNAPRTIAPPVGPAGDGVLGLGGGSGIKSGLGTRITAAGKNAFGSLAGGVSGDFQADRGRAVKMMAPGVSPAPQFLSAPEEGADLSSSSAAEAPALGLGGGGAAGLAAGSASPDTMIARYLPSVGYDFRYSGELDLGAASVDVLKREKSLDAQLLAGMVSRVDLGLMDLGRLSDLNVQNVSLVENKDYGYWVNINFDDGSININQNWQRWPQPYAYCSPGADCSPPRLAESDMPSDGELLRIAADFVSEMGISTESYGEPRVDDSWRQYYAAAEDQADYWFPDQMTVEYPLLVNGLKVYNGDGRAVGMMVGVDVRSRRVSGISPIYSQAYVSSAYDAVTDAALVTGLIAKGGIQPMYSEGAEKMVTFDLEAPEPAYYSHWLNDNGRSENVLVPALVFGIKDRPRDGSVWLEKVVVPLARDVLEQAGGGYPMLLKSGAEPAVLGAPSSISPTVEVQIEPAR